MALSGRKVAIASPDAPFPFIARSPVLAGEIRIKVDRDALARYGLNAEDVLAVVKNGIGGGEFFQRKPSARWPPWWSVA